MVGIPSVIVAFASYVFATRAHSEAMQASRGKVDAEAYEQARTIYESSLEEMRRQIADLRIEVGELKAELRNSGNALHEAMSRIWDLEHHRTPPEGFPKVKELS
jgi:septal ring factor EnvC (AmiA/AmiB activator)